MKSKKKERIVKQRVHIKFLQDASGSMASCWHDCVGGFKTFIDDLRAKEDVDYTISLSLFHSGVQAILTAAPLSEVRSDKLSSYRASGRTALYDALGDMLTAPFRDSEFDKIIYIIVTDGEENESRKWNKDTIHSLIDSKRVRIITWYTSCPTARRSF